MPGDPQMQAAIDAKLRDTALSVGSMSPDDLIAAYKSEWSAAWAGQPSTDGASMAKLASLIASKENDVPLEIKEQDEDFWQERGLHQRLLKIYADELRARGYAADFAGGPGAPTWTLKPLEGETGHYDDGHAFGWKAPASNADTADDAGGIFGWGAVTKVTNALPRNMLVAGATVLVVIGAIVFVARPSGSATVASDATKATAGAATNVASPARTGALDTCGLVTIQEATGILAGQPVTTRATTPPGPQCEYDVKPAAVFSFQERSRVARITINAVIITVYTGAQAASQYDAKQQRMGKDTQNDQVVAGVGDKAVYINGGERAGFQGTRFMDVSTQSDRDWGDGNVRYEDVHLKFISILVAFAQSALPRM